VNIKDIKDRILNGEYEFRKHALERASSRGINPFEIKEALLEGEIIESYPDDPRGSSCLIYGKSRKGKNLHIVCGLAHNIVWIITAYEPSEKEWINYRRRRE